MPFSQSETVRAENPNAFPNSVCESFLSLRNSFIYLPNLLSIVQSLAENPLKYLTWRKIRHIIYYVMKKPPKKLIEVLVEVGLGIVVFVIVPSITLICFNNAV